MARQVRVEIVGDSRSLERAFGNAGRSSQGFGGKLRNLSVVLGATLFDLEQLGHGLKAIADVAMQGQASEARLSTAFKDAGLSAQKYAGQVDSAEKSGRNLGFTNTEVRDSLSKLVLATGDMGKARADLNVAEDLARFKHMDVAQAAQIEASAMAGNTRAIKQLGILVLPVTSHLQALKNAHVDLKTAQGQQLEQQAKLADKQATAALVIQKLTEKVKGQAAAFAATAAGGFAKFRAGLDAIAEKVGSKVLPVLGRIATSAANAIGGAIDWFGKLAKEVGKQHTFAAKLRVIWSNVKETAVDLANRLADYFWRGWTVKIGGVEGGGHAKNALTNFHKGMLAGLQNVDWGAVGKAILDGIIKGIQVTADLAKKVLSAVDSAMSQIDWGSVGVKLGPAFAAMVVAGFVTLTDPSFWIQHWQLALSVALVAFGGALGKFATRAGMELAFALDRIAPEAATAMLGVVMKVGDVAGKLVGVLGRAFEPVEALVRRVFGRLGSIAVFVVKVLGIEAVIRAISNMAVTIAGALARVATAAYDKAKEIGSRILDGIKAALKAIWNVIAGLTSDLANGIGSIATNAYHYALAIGHKLMQGVKDGVSSMIGTVKGFIETAVQPWNWKGPPEKDYRLMFNVGQVLMQGLMGGARSLIPQTKGVFEGIGDSIKMTVDKIAATMGRSGEAIIQGLIAGLKQQIPQLRQTLDQALGTLGGNIVSAADALGPNFGTKKTRAMGAQLTAEQQALADQQAKEQADSLQRAIDQANQRLQSDIASGADQATIDADKQSLADAQQQLADYQAQLKIDADTKALAEQQKRDKDNLEKQWAALQAEVKAHPERAAKVKAEIDKLLEKYGITPASVQASQDWNAAQTLFVSSLGDVVGALNALNTTLQQINNLTGAGAAQGGMTHKASGGFIGGAGSGDIIPAMLEPGEYVVKKKAVNALGLGFMHSINRYADGGYVSDSDYAQKLRDAHGKWPPVRRYQQGWLTWADKTLANYQRQYGDRLHEESGAFQAVIALATHGGSLPGALNIPPNSVADATWGQVWYDFPGSQYPKGWAWPPPGLTGKLPSLDVGGTFLSDGLVFGHKGETIAPAKVAPLSGGTAIFQGDIILDGEKIGRHSQQFLIDEKRFGRPGITA